MPINFPGNDHNWQTNTAIGTYTQPSLNGQTWHNPGRNSGSWYQNTTGRPIQIAPGMLTSSALFVGRSTTAYVQVVATGGDHSEAMNGAIVPNGWYYKMERIRTYSELS